MREDDDIVLSAFEVDLAEAFAATKTPDEISGMMRDHEAERFMYDKFGTVVLAGCYAAVAAILLTRILGQDCGIDPWKIFIFAGILTIYMTISHWRGPRHAAVLRLAKRLAIVRAKNAPPPQG